MSYLYDKIFPALVKGLKYTTKQRLVKTSLGS